MTKYRTPFAACLLTFAMAGTARAQDNPAPPMSARLEGVISRSVGETKVGSQPFSLFLKTGEKGSLTMESTGSVDSDARKLCAAPKEAPHAGTRLDATVRPKADDRFSIELTITERAFAGCRTVNTVSIPVFSNRIVAKSVTLKSGETTQVDLGGSATSEAIKVDVTLVIEK